MPLRVFWRASAAAVALLLFLVPDASRAQGAAVDSARLLQVPKAWIPVLRLSLPPTMTPFGRALQRGEDSRVIASMQGDAMQRRMEQGRSEQWLRTMMRARETRDLALLGSPTTPVPSVLDTLGMQKPDSGLAALLNDLLGDESDLTATMVAKLEAKLDRSRNERCTASQYFAFASQCSAGFQPNFDLQFNLNARGSVAGRFFVNVDYDTQREFRSSDNINVFYQGKSDEWIQRIEFGNVALTLPPSQFITSVPAGNLGVQAIGQLGSVQFRGIVAQQQGNIPKNYDVVVGEKTVKADNREIEDYQVETGRFFFTVDPVLFGAAYPNVDILNGVQMRALAAGLPETQRPIALSVYRVLRGGQAPNPNGPRFALLERPEAPAGEIYQLLQEKKDYYTDPSLLWIALRTQLNPNERLVVAYTLRVGGRDTVIAELGGTPDVSFRTDRPQFAHLLWDSDVKPSDPTFRRELRSVYRIAGEDLRRQSVSVRIMTGGGTGREKPIAGLADTYLQMFGLSQSGNPALFDIENRLWPRPSDPNVAVGDAASTKIIRDFFLVLPSTRPFARDGLVQPGNPASDTIYATLREDLYSQQHPQSNYRILLRYDIEGGGNIGEISLGESQLRKNSEAVTVDGNLLVRETDYHMDYELGIVTFTRPDTLFRTPRRVSVRYEQNPLFAAAPTSILGFSGLMPMERGSLGLTVLSQKQSTSFTRPPLGYEPQASFIAGLNGRWRFEAAPLSRLLEKIPTIESTTLSHVDFQGEIATSRPQPNSAGAAHLETFEGEGGIAVPLQDAAWFYSSQPALGVRLPQRLGATTLNLNRASTMAWQGSGLTQAGIPYQFTLSQIDPQANITTGSGISAPEPMLWLTLYPLKVGGLLSDRTKKPQWLVNDEALAPSGRRWRSVRAGLGPSGADLSRVEYIKFWTLIDTSMARRATNPTLIIDLGDNSENSVLFGPTTLDLITDISGNVDSLFTGKQFIGLNQLDTERDSLTRSFNQATDDRGLPGDVVPFLNVFKGDQLEILENFRTCARNAFQLLLIGDARANCTVGNGRLDEEDVDFDNVLNLVDTQRESERIRRYIVDLSNPASYTRMGKCSVAAFDTAGGGTVTATDLCWVQVRVPFGAPDDSVNGGPNIRRVRSVRLTLVSGEGAADTAYTQVPLALFRFEGSTLIKRSDRTVRGIAGDLPSQGFAIASVIGTQDRDSLRAIDYEPPPGVNDAAETQQTGLEATQTVINERSLRLLAGRMGLYERAEAFVRFPEGVRNFMNYRELRVWARGRGNGWGSDGDLQFYIKIGRDANNFYLYRTSINSGLGREAWTPEVRMDFEQLTQLRTLLQNNLFTSVADSIACTGVDSALIANSGIPIGQPVNRHAACANGYMVYSVDPAVNPPNLAQVQEIAVGIVRVSQNGGSTPIMLADTLEVWVDDIRLTNVFKTPGYAAQASLSVQAGDVASFRFNATRRDPHFRQLAEQPSFLGSNGFDFATAIRLERLIPGALNYSIPFTVSHTTGSTNPLFLSQTDIDARGVENLRTPKSEATRYSLSARRVTPLVNSPWGFLLNNMFVNANLAHANSRSEFSDGGTSTWNVGVDYNLQGNARYKTLPKWLRLGTGDDNRIRWNPRSIRFSTDLGHASDNRLSFSKPVEVATDTGRRVTGLTHVLRTMAAMDIAPVSSISASVVYTTVRDLRDYGDTSATAVVASGAREKLLGVDMGLERERQFTTSASFEPTVVSYFRPRFTYTSLYAMQRDPQSRQLVRTGDSTGAFRLPGRLSNSQIIAAASSIDPGHAITSWFGDGPRATRIANIFQQLDIEYSRSLSSSYDAAPFLPGLGYQFGFGGLEDFRGTNDRRATIAGFADQFTLSTGFRVARNIDISTRAQAQTTDNYTRRLDNTQALIHGRNEMLPEISVRWSDSLAWLRKRVLFGKEVFSWLKVIQNLALNVTYRRDLLSTFVPAETPEAEPDRRSDYSRRVPVSGSIAWNDGGSLTTNFAFSRQHRTSTAPGSVTETKGQQFVADLARSFPLPQRLKAISRLRTHVGWRRETQASYISVNNSTKPSRLADNGLQRLDLNAATDVATNLSFSLQGSHIVTFDNNLNRRFSQLVVTTAFTLQFNTFGSTR